ncbi:amidohydrolase family protein [Candidatus Woesearchaeota archaeon]|nr:amidohydrolase family protein [Candidatus Woesearchaeota archaeon]
MSLLIKNGKVYLEGNLVSKNIFIEKDKITKITSSEVKADKVIDASNKIIIPGLIDPHVHFRDPGLTHKEDFLTGSMAAAAGGITTIQDMPNTLPPVNNLQVLDEKRKAARKSVVNYGLYFGCDADNLSEIEKASNVPAVKVYMDHTTGNLLLNDNQVLEKIFTSNKFIAVHAEKKNVKRCLDLIEKGDNGIYFCHISSKQELDDTQSKSIENNVYVEVSPQHLFLTKDDLNNLEAFGEMKPSLKTKSDQKALWKGIKDGTVDTIGTDHAPHTKEEKLAINYPFGIPGCETLLPLLLNAMHENKITLNKIIELCSENPANIFKIKNKGFIKEGYDADLTIIDLDLEKEVKNEELFTKCSWSPFNSWNLKGWPIMTIVLGEIIFDNGKINKISAREVEYGK